MELTAFSPSTSNEAVEGVDDLTETVVCLRQGQRLESQVKNHNTDDCFVRKNIPDDHVIPGSLAQHGLRFESHFGFPDIE